MTSVANGELRYQLWDLLWFHSCLINSSCLLLSSVSMCWRRVPEARAPVLGRASVPDSKWKRLPWTWEPPCWNIFCPFLPLWCQACVWADDPPIAAAVAITGQLRRYFCMIIGCAHLGHSPSCSRLTDVYTQFSISTCPRCPEPCLWASPQVRTHIHWEHWPPATSPPPLAWFLSSALQIGA